METTGTSWQWHTAGSFPAGGSLVFSRSLDRGSSSASSTLPPTQLTAFQDYSEYVDSYRLEIQGPRDERDLGKCLGGPVSPSTNMDEVNFAYEACVHVPPETQMLREKRRPMTYAVLPEKEEALVTTALYVERVGNDEEEDDEEKEEERREGAESTRPLPCHRRSRPAPAARVELLDHMPKGGSGPRRPRQKGNWWHLLDHFGSASCFRDMCSLSIVEKRGHRKNNEHWTPEEVKVLVDGVSKLGVGHWSQLKDRWFSDSVREAVHLKDKWRNLLKAYTVRPTSKKKGNALLDKELIKKIRMLAADNPYPK